MNILFTCAGRRNYLLQYFRDALSGTGKIIGVDSDINATALQEVDVAREVPSCLLYTSPSPRDATLSRMPSSA